MNIYMIRHGRQSSKLCNVNVDLSDEGRRQAVLLGERLSLEKIDAIYSSQLIRAVETAQIVNQYFKVPHIIRTELEEMSFGFMEGMSDERIAAAFADFKIEQKKMETDLPYPGGEGAEDVIKRAMPVFKEITASGYQNVAVITHGGVIRSMIAAFLHLEPKYSRLMGTTLENCSITKVVWNEEEHIFSMEGFNDYCHLKLHPELLRSSWVETEN